GQVPFHTTQGLDVLPIEGRVYYKRRLTDSSDQQRSYYEQLYASFRGTAGETPPTFVLYETLPLQTGNTNPIDLGADTVDGALWIALIVRASDKPYEESVKQARNEIAGK